jgi:hypothetical protein
MLKKTPKAAATKAEAPRISTEYPFVQLTNSKKGGLALRNPSAGPSKRFTNPLSITSQFAFCGLPLRMDAYAFGARQKCAGSAQ